MLTYAVIRDMETDVNQAVVVHSAELGRVVIKSRDPGSAIDRALQMHYDGSLIVQEPENINGAMVLRRRRSVPKDSDYINNLLDKAVKIPYEVRTIRTIESAEGIDHFVDKLASEQLTEKRSVKRKKRANGFSEDG
jgi:hypothetical protein